MKRRDLITLAGNSENIALSLDEYITPLDYAKAIHLIRRLAFYPEPDKVAGLVGKTAAEAFDIIVGDATDAPPQPTQSMKSWLDVLEENPLDGLPNDIRAEIEGRHRSHFNEFSTWWLDNMRTDTFPSQEKLTLFLHSIWCCEFVYDTLAMIPPPLLYRNNATLRKYRLSDYKTIAKEITLDGAMLMYQSLFFSGKAAPNENYMRELMELFTMGIADISTGTANYTEGDIREGARAFTGWRTVAYLGQNGAPSNRPFSSFFVKAEHDTNGKKIMQFGQIAAISDNENTEDLVKNNEVNKVVDILFNEKGMSIARFICEKIYRYFIYSDPGSVNYIFVNELAQYMFDNAFDLRKVYKKLFTSQYFYSDTVRGCQIKTPTEFIIGLERIFGVDYDSINSVGTRSAVTSLEQILYTPPNVAGWKAYRTWISTSTYPLRANYAKDMISIITDDQVLNFIKKFPDYSSSTTKLASALIAYLLPLSISQVRTDRFKTTLMNGLNESDWINGVGTKNAKVIEGIRAFLTSIVLSPDFQLS
ncbi:MAG: DUF1800 family protein [Candidatus Kapabacteria bacterium]|nr:DUF1800 family protein [Candidatus Kapabacteria bacterium]